MNNLKKREDLLREKERIESSLKELEIIEIQERKQKENSEKLWDKQSVWIVVSGLNEGNYNNNASARVNVYLTKDHALAHYDCSDVKQSISSVRIGSETWTWIDLENKPDREGQH